MLRSALAFLVSVVCLLALFGFTERTFSPVFQGCVEKNKQGGTDSTSKDYVSASIAAVNVNIRCSGDFIDANANSITALATIIIAAFTATLWAATTRQAKLTKEALVADKRAFINFKNIMGYWELDNETRQYNWRFRPSVENTGDTPTARLTLHTSCELRNNPLPTDFKFVTAPDRIGAGLLGPKSASYGGLAPLPPTAALTPQDLHDVQMGKKYLYLWGWARYFDVFPDTERHITHFAWAVMVRGDPSTYHPKDNPNLAFDNLYLQTGNCADDECRLQGLG